MAIKLQIFGSKDLHTLQRGATLPNEGDVMRLVLKGEKKEKEYTVYLIEHVIDFNKFQVGSEVIVTLKPLKKSGV